MKQIAVALLFICMVAIGVSYTAAFVLGAAPVWSAWVVAVATPTAMVATMMLGAARAGRPCGGLTRLVVPLIATLIVVAGAFTLALLLPGGAEPPFLGLPRRAAMILFGVGLVPVLILPLAYALTFDELTLGEDDLERARAAARANEGLSSEEPVVRATGAAATESQ